MNLYFTISCLLALFFLTSCSMTKGLKEGELLLYKTNYEFTNPKLVNKQNKIETDLMLIARPTPASGLEKWQVAIYNNTNKKGKEKGIGNWIQHKIGKPPALYDESTIERSRLVMEKYMQDQGYFGSTIESDTTKNGKKVSLTYSITSKGQYFIKEIFRPVDTLPITHLMKENEGATLLKTGQPYNLTDLTAERDRLANLANNNGFYEVNKDNFFYFVDSTAGHLQADIYLRLKQTGDSSMYQVYFLDDSWVYPDYSLEKKGASEGEMDTVSYRLLKIIQKEKVLRPTVLSRLVWQDSVSVFSKKEQQNSINRLLNLGIYKFVNIRFEKQENDSLLLDRYVYLTPGKMHDISAELQLNSRSGNFLGTEVSGTFTHKNLFHGAELFNVSLSAGMETNIGANANSSINTLNLGVNASIQLPGFYAPFVKRDRVKGETLPRTAFSIGDEYQNRTGFYTLNSFNLSLGYNMQRGFWTHQFSPVFINLVNLLSTSSELDAIIAQNRRLRASFENVLILGANHKLTYSKKSLGTMGNTFYYQGGVEVAGNGLYLATAATSQNTPREVLGIPFSQYFKVDNEVRQYLPLRKGMLAGRFSVGVAYPYCNAEVIPYIKQYFVGGASSVRAFRIRTLGPGSYQTTIVNDGSNFVDQTGDIKMEMNAEYRFPLFSFLKGALFVDAGNVWLIRGDADDSTPEQEGLFRFDQFYNELAVGTGFGFRLDFDVAVIRLDLAFPLRGPSQSNFKWLFSELDFLSKDWRMQNLVWNIAIGYPF